MAKFKVVRNVHLFASYSIDSNLQDKIAGQDGRGRFANLTGEDLQKIIDKDSKQKYLWGRPYSKTNTTWLFREVVKITGPSPGVPLCWMRETTSLRFTSASSLRHPTRRDQ